MGTVYIDLLVIINLYVTFFLIKATGVFLHRRVSVKRSLAGAFAGGATSLVILLPELPFYGNIAVKIAAGLLITLIAFGVSDVCDYLKCALMFIIINVVFAGLTLMLWYFAAPLGMVWNNGVIYFDISFAAITITTIAAYGAIRLVRYLLDVKFSGSAVYSVRITREDKTVTLSALADSGNMLTDYFSGLSVIICCEEEARAVIPPELAGFSFNFDADKDPPAGIRFLPYKTISGGGVIPVFKADAIVIKKDGGKEKSVTALVGITRDKTEQGYSAIFNPRLLL